MSAQTEYWRECVQSAMEEAGLEATVEQIEDVAAAVGLAHENYGLAFYQPTENPLAPELRSVKEELDEERRMVNCEQCGGKGSITTFGPGGMCSTSQCLRCHGHGRHLP